MNILLTSAGRRVGLLRRFKEESEKKIPYSCVFACDMNPVESSACHFADRSFAVKPLGHEQYLPELLNICVENEIKLVVPTIDTELKLLSENRNLFKQSGIEVVISDSSLIECGNDKKLTHDFFVDHNVAVARQINRDRLEFPFLAKPVSGSSSKGIFIFHNQDDVFPAILKNEKMLCVEYFDPVDYEEYTVDAYYNKTGSLCCAVPRLRISTRGGEVAIGRTSKNLLVDTMFEKLANIPGMRGVVTWQFFLNKHDGRYFGSEFNPRFGGGVLLSIGAGANFPEWIIKEYLLNEKVEIYSDWKENLTMLRFDEEILF